VPRPGLAALDPVNGVPLSWNPGRNPRGHGAEALLATASGLWVGSDTTAIGNYAYYRGRVAFFPLAGGRTLPVANTGSLPGNLVLAGRLSTPPGTSVDDALRRSYDGGTGVGPTTVLPASGIPWSQARGAFMVNGRLYYGLSDGNLYTRTFNGTTFGPATLIDPYNDPTWSSVQTGSGNTYQGVKSGFYGEIPNVTGMFYSAGRIYYTLTGDPTPPLPVLQPRQRHRGGPRRLGRHRHQLGQRRRHDRGRQPDLLGHHQRREPAPGQLHERTGQRGQRHRGQRPRPRRQRLAHPGPVPASQLTVRHV